MIFGLESSSEAEQQRSSAASESYMHRISAKFLCLGCTTPFLVGFTHGIQNRIMSWVTWALETAAVRVAWPWMVEHTRTYAYKYPPLAAVFGTFVAMSLVPLVMFVVFGVGSLLTLLVVALSLVAVVEGGVLLGGGTLLALALAICGVISFAFTASLGSLWTAIFTGRALLKRVRSLLGMFGMATAPSALHKGVGGGRGATETYGSSPMAETRKTAEELKRSIRIPIQ